MAKSALSVLIHFHFFHYYLCPKDTPVSVSNPIIPPDARLDHPLIHRLSTLLSQRHLQCIRTKCIALLSKFDFAPTSSLHSHPVSHKWRKRGVIYDSFLSFLHSPVSHQILLLLPPTSVPCPASTHHPQCQRPTSEQNHLLGILQGLPDDYSWLSPLQSQLTAIPIWSNPIIAPSLDHSPLSKLTVSLLKVQIVP